MCVCVWVYLSRCCLRRLELQGGRAWPKSKHKVEHQGRTDPLRLFKSTREAHTHSHTKHSDFHYASVTLKCLQMCIGIEYWKEKKVGSSGLGSIPSIVAPFSLKWKAACDFNSSRTTEINEYMERLFANRLHVLQNWMLLANGICRWWYLPQINGTLCLMERMQLFIVILLER